MKEDEATLPPVKQSASGRVPQWAMDEALGRPSAPTAFRAAPSTSAESVTGGRRRHVGRWVVVMLGVGALVAVSVVFKLPLTASQQATTLPVSQGRAAPPAPRSGPLPGHEEAAARILPALAAPSSPPGPTYRFMSLQKGSAEPVTWSPCRPLHYVVRSQGQPIFGPDVIRKAIAEMRAATGLDVVDDGLTIESPALDREVYQPKVYGDRYAPVLISWASSSEVPDFGVDVIGEAAPQGVRVPGGAKRWVSGVVTLDATRLGRLGSHETELVLLHELGHLMGLAHVSDRAEVMFPSEQPSLTGLGPGDRAGLAALGRGPCQPDS